LMHLVGAYNPTCMGPRDLPKQECQPRWSRTQALDPWSQPRPVRLPARQDAGRGQSARLSERDSKSRSIRAGFPRRGV